VFVPNKVTTDAEKDKTADAKDEQQQVLSKPAVAKLDTAKKMYCN
jgi:hypothetical protein